MPIAGLQRLARPGALTDVAAVLGLLLWAPAAQAGPPFRTDDPVPVEPGHWKIFTFSTATHVAGDTAGILSGIDANYGAAPGPQLHATFPVAFDKPDGGGMAVGYGDTEFGFKYRFLEADEAGWRPQAAIYPAIDLPTGSAARNLGTGHTHAPADVGAEDHRRLHDLRGRGLFDQYRVDHRYIRGVGYPGPGNRNDWYLGWAVQRSISDNLSLGGELFHLTTTTVGSKDQTGLDLGLTYDLNDHYHLLLSVGPGIQKSHHHQRLLLLRSIAMHVLTTGAAGHRRSQPSWRSHYPLSERLCI